MKIAVVGSRDFPDTGFVQSIVTQLCKDLPDMVLVSGGARGVDSWAEKIAKRKGIQTEIYPADWNRLGKAAGFIRNQDIVKAADLILIFWDGQSKGTQHTLELAQKARKPFNLYMRPKLS